MGAQRSVDPNVPQYQLLRDTGNGPTVANEAELLAAVYGTPGPPAETAAPTPPTAAETAAPAPAAEGGAA